jgi:hypothetical protein
MDAEHSAKHSDLFDRKPVKVALFVVIPAVIFALVCAGIRVSQYGIDHTIVVVGQRQLLAGAPAALRVTLIADDQGFFLPDRITGHLVRGERRHQIYDGDAADAGHALALNFRVPRLEPGPAVLELEIRFDERRRIVRADVEIVDTPPAEQLTTPGDTDLAAEPYRLIKDGARIEALTEDRGAPTGLTSVLFLRALRDGKPAAIEIGLGLPAELGGEPERSDRRTDRLGIAAVPIKPFELNAPVRVWDAVPEDRADAGVDGGSPVATEAAHLYPRVVYAGLTAALHDPIVRKDESIRTTVSQISQGGPLYAEVFQDGRWVLAASGWLSGTAAEVDIDPPVTGLLRIQFTTSALAPGNTIAVRHVYVLDEGESLDDGLRAILERVERSAADRAWAEQVFTMPLERGGFDRRIAAAFALSRLYAGHQLLPRLVSSRQEDDAELAEFKASFQRYVMLTIILVGVGVALLIAMIAIQAQRRQSRISLMIEADGDGDGDGPEPEFVTDLGARGARRRVLVQGVILCLILIGAFASIALLVDTLTWGG